MSNLLGDKPNLNGGLLHDIQIANLRGQWCSLLQQAGISEHYLTGKHGPCHFCGGKDRFRFDDKNGSGSAFCNTCGAMSGFSFLARALGFDPRKEAGCVFDFIRQHLGILSHKDSAEIKQSLHTDVEKRRTLAKQIWDESISLDDPAAIIGCRYLLNRGLANFKNISSLRFHEQCFYSKSDGKGLFYPALVSRVDSVSGSLLGVQRIYLDDDGFKAKVLVCKKSLGSISGGSVHLEEPAHAELAVTEGVETGLAVREMFKYPVWAALSTSGMKALIIPSYVKRVHIFADKDKNLAGANAAMVLKSRLIKSNVITSINLPKINVPTESTSIDFLDVLSNAYLKKS